MRTFAIVCVLLLLGSGVLEAETVSRASGFSSRELSNGMEVLLREDHATPIVSILVFIRAGAVSEEPSTAGLTHLLEHLLFDGTQSYSREALKDRIDHLGGYANAFTREEYTAYMMVVPREFAREGIEIQSDMLLNSILPEDELAKERNVVLEEMKKDRDNPDYVSQELFSAAFYRGTPYANPVLGQENSIRTVSRSTVMSYYRRFYVPSNMVAIVIGDFEPEDVVGVLEKTYGTVPSRAASPRPAINWRPVSGVRREMEVAGTQTRNVYLRLGFPGPLVRDPDAPALELLSEILVGREDSRLNRALTAGQQPLADNVEGGYETFRHAAGLQVLAMARNPQDMDRIVTAVQGELRRVREEIVGQAELERIKTAYRVKDAFDTESYMYQAMDITHWLSLADLEFKDMYYQRIARVTPEHLQRVARKYLKGDNMLISALVPQPPPDSAGRPARSPRMARKVLPNGLILLAKEDPDSRITATHVLVKNRSRLEPFGKEGLANFVSEMLLEGTASRSGRDVAQEIEAMGARVKVVDDPRLPYDDYYESRGFSYIRLETIAEFTERGLDLLSDLLQNASFPQASLEKIRARVSSTVKRTEDSVGKTGKNFFFYVLFAGTAYQNTIAGRQPNVDAMTRDDLVSYYGLAYAPNNLIISIVSPRSPEELISLLESRLGGMKRVEPVLRDWNPTQPRGKGLVRRPQDKEQAYIYLGTALPPPTDPAVPALHVMAEILSDRLGRNLREKQGLAYSVGATVGFVPETGWCYAAMGTRNENVEKARKGIGDEIEKLRQGLVKSEELSRVVNSYWGHLLRFHQTHIGQAYYLGLHEYLGNGYEYDLRFADELRRVTALDVQQAALKYLDPAQWLTMVVGDLERIDAGADK